MHKLRCHSCSKELPAGSLKYVVEVRSYADFDGYIEECEGDIEEGIGFILDAMENADPEALEDDVIKEQVFILCKPCRDKLVNDPFHTGRPSPMDDEVKGTVH